MVAGADGDAELVEQGAYVVGMGVAHEEGDDGGLVRGGAEDAQAWHLVGEAGGGIG